MRFCRECESVMTKSTTATGNIVFQCRCQLTEDGQPDDTLMYEEYMTAIDHGTHEVFIENAPYDPAGNVVLKDCPQCGLNFMVMVRIGERETTVFSCSCSYRATYDEYMKHISEGKKSPQESAKAEKQAPAKAEKLQ